VEITLQERLDPFPSSAAPNEKGTQITFVQMGTTEATASVPVYEREWSALRGSVDSTNRDTDVHR